MPTQGTDKTGQSHRFPGLRSGMKIEIRKSFKEPARVMNGSSISIRINNFTKCIQDKLRRSQ